MCNFTLNWYNSTNYYPLPITYYLLPITHYPMLFGPVVPNLPEKGYRFILINQEEAQFQFCLLQSQQLAQSLGQKESKFLLI